MAKSETIIAAERELSLYNIKSNLEYTSHHVKVTWLSPKGEPRCYLTTINESDPRAKLNARAQVRRILKNDGVFNTLKENIKTLNHALTTPVIVTPEPITNRLKRMEDDIAGLIDIVHDLMSRNSIPFDTLTIAGKNYQL